MPFLMEQFTGQQQRQADLALKQQQVQANALQLQQEQAFGAALQEEYSKDEPTPTQGGFTPDGQITSPTISFLEKQVKAAALARSPTHYKDAIKMLEDARNKESEIQKRNSEINKDTSERKAAAAQYALDNKDIEGGLAIMSKYDPVGAMRLYAALPKDATGKIAYSPQLEQMLKKTVAENTTLKEMEDIKAKKLAEQDKENYRQESLDIRREAAADRRAEQAARREERASIREERKAKEAKKEKRIGKLSDPKEVERTADELKQDHPKLDAPSRSRAAEDIRTRQKELMRADEDLSAKDAYDQAYEEVSTKIKDDKGYLFGFGAKSTYGKESKPVTTLPSGWTVKEK